MNKSVWTERLPKGYSVRYWTEVSPGVFKKQREWFEDYNLAQKRKAEIKIRLLSKSQGMPDPTLKASEAFDSYIVALTPTHRPTTLDLKTDALMIFLESVGPLSNLTLSKIQKWKTEMIASLNINTVGLRLRELRAFCNWATKEKLFHENPFTGVTIPQGKEVGRKLELTELQAILENADTVFRPYLLFLIYTGARRSEILKTKWRDVNIVDKVWTIPAANSKSKRERTVPLSNQVMETLALLPRQSDNLFHGYATNTAEWYLKKALRKAKIEGRVRLHDFRHTFASHWSGDPRILADMVGWAGMSMLRRYSHFNLADVRSEATLSGIGAKLGQIGAYPHESSNSSRMSNQCKENVTNPILPTENK